MQGAGCRVQGSGLRVGRAASRCYYSLPQLCRATCVCGCVCVLRVREKGGEREESIARAPESGGGRERSSTRAEEEEGLREEERDRVCAPPAAPYPSCARKKKTQTATTSHLRHIRSLSLSLPPSLPLSGGETVFLRQGMRIEAKQGRVAMFPTAKNKNLKSQRPKAFTT